MKLPLHTTSATLVGKEARRVIRTVNAGRAVSNARARAFAAECVSQLDAELGKAIPPSPLRATSIPMPTISRFYGIQITLRPAELNHSRAHFHAEYAEFAASIAIDTLEVLAGSLPPRALELTLFWAAMHRAELLAGWQAMRAGRNPDKIQPLD